jgi:catechol 2,3-dioxygenase-like lactoylglutathione lyase family enzyme
MAIKLIHHVNVQVSDRERTRAWYEKVLGAEFLDRGPALNRRQLQLRLGSGEIHFTVTPRPVIPASSHFAIEVDDWEATMAHLDRLGIEHVRTSAASTGADPLGLQDSQGRRVEITHDPNGLRWVQIPGFVEAEHARER